MKASNNLYLIIAGAVVLAGASFYGGMQYQKSRQPANARGFFAQQTGDRSGNMPFGQQGVRRVVGGTGGQVTMGEVVSKDDTSFTVKLQGDEGSKVILLASSTSIGKMAEGTADDLSEGTNVVVTGSANSDGSITATMIQIRPAGEDSLPAGWFMRFGAPPADGQAQ
jgi:hypothetical protein